MKLKHTTYLLLCLLLMATACSKEEENADSRKEPSMSNRLRVTADKSDFSDEQGRTRTTTGDNTHLTTFETGDAIGVTAVDADGNVLAQCSNVKLTYNATTKTWEGAVYFLTQAAEYFAYSPYSTTMNGKNSTDAIYAAFTLNDDQSTKELFSAADLMTSTSCTANKTNKTLNIVFAHRMALIEVPARVDTFYVRNTNGFEYPITAHTLQSLLIGGLGDVGKKYYTTPSKTRRYLVAPDTKDIFVGASYKDNAYDDKDVYRSSEGSVDAPTVGGACKRVYFLKDRAIAVGDYYYSDGSIYPVGWNPSPPGVDKGCIGIVFSTDPLQSDKNRGWTNGYVLAVKSADSKVGVQNSTYKGSHHLTGSGTLYEKILANTNSGYEEMEANSNNPEVKILDFNGIILTYRVYELYWMAKEFREISTVPRTGTSSWFPPSIKQLIIAVRNLVGFTDSFLNSPSEDSWRKFSTEGTNLTRTFNSKFTLVGGMAPVNISHPSGSANSSVPSMITCSKVVEDDALFQYFILSTKTGIDITFGILRGTDSMIFNYFRPMLAF